MTSANEKRPLQSPWWTQPALGIGGATTAFHSIASPLLAGFAVVVAVEVASNRDHFGAADLVLASAVAAAAVLLLSLQIAFAASQYWIEPDRYKAWYPDWDDPEFRDRALDRQLDDIANWQWRNFRSRRLYQVGIVMFLATLFLAMLPRWAESYVPPTEITQFFAPAIALLALVVEVLWIGGSILEPNDGDLRKQKDQILHGE